MSKLNMYYILSTKYMTKEIDDFWEGIQLPKKLIVDADNILGIFSYILVQAQDAEFISDIKFISKFLTRTIEVTSRGY